MIESFACDETRATFQRHGSRKLPPDIHRMALRKLVMLDAAVDMNDLRAPPANRLEKLHGKREGQYSVWINVQWRLCFRWQDGNAQDGEITDYH